MPNYCPTRQIYRKKRSRFDPGNEANHSNLLRKSDMCARSSTGQSIGLRIRGLGVQIPSGAPMILPINRTLSVRRAFYLFRPDTAIFDHLLAPELAPAGKPVRAYSGTFRVELIRERSRLRLFGVTIGVLRRVQNG